MNSPKIKIGISPLAHFEPSLNRFNVYSDSLQIDKESKRLLKDSFFIDNNFAFYLCYPYLFASAFNVDEKKVADLSIAGYLYYKSIIFMDELLDKNKISMELVTKITICQEEAIKLLSSIFPLSSQFWKNWNQRRIEYLNAFHVDKVLLNVKSFKEFEVHAGNKSAFGKVAIDALNLLSLPSDVKLYQKLLKGTSKNSY